jgi:hypothetical protein
MRILPLLIELAEPLNRDAAIQLNDVATLAGGGKGNGKGRGKGKKQRAAAGKLLAAASGSAAA